jgi:propanediol dehydratase large subunit
VGQSVGLDIVKNLAKKGFDPKCEEYLNKINLDVDIRIMLK